MGRRNSENNDRRTEQFRKLFVGGLSPQTDEMRLKKYYEQWGELVDFVVMKDVKTTRSRGFGFVTYLAAEMVDEAQSQRPHEIDGKTVETKRAMPREDSGAPETHMTVCKLFVGGLKKDVCAEHLRAYFTDYGVVTDCEVVLWKDSAESRGFGFVTFDDYDPVDKAILYKPHQILSSRADVKKALSKDEIDEIRRKQQNEVAATASPSSTDSYHAASSLSSLHNTQSTPYLLYDPVYHNPALQYSLNHPQNWSGSSTLNSNYYYTRPMAELGQYLAPVMNFGGIVTNIQGDVNDTIENQNFRTTSTTEENNIVQIL